MQVIVCFENFGSFVYYFFVLYVVSYSLNLFANQFIYFNQVNKKYSIFSPILILQDGGTVQIIFCTDSEPLTRKFNCSVCTQHGVKFQLSYSNCYEVRLGFQMANNLSRELFIRGKNTQPWMTGLGVLFVVYNKSILWQIFMTLCDCHESPSKFLLLIWVNSDLARLCLGTRIATNRLVQLDVQNELATIPKCKTKHKEMLQLVKPMKALSYISLIRINAFFGV